MATTEVSIPSIKFCKPGLKPGTSEWESTKAQVFQALQEYGYFEAIYDEVPNEIPKKIFNILEKEVVPVESKLSAYFDKPYQRYEGKIPRFRYETLRAVDLLLPESIETFVNTFWPDGNPEYCNMLTSYTNSLVELDEMVKVMVLESLGLQNYIEELFDANALFLRITHYKAKNEDGKQSGLVPHTDAGFLSIIKQNQVGLELLNKNGEWTKVNVTPNSYIVLSADSFKAWTNGRVQSPMHRVTIEGDTDRYSMQIFSAPEPDYTVEAPKKLVDEEHPLLVKPYNMSGYYEYVMSGSKAGHGLVGLLQYYLNCSNA